MTTTDTAAVRTLTAEVRVLQVGNRQITQSVVKQLDVIRADRIEPFGRISTGAKVEEASGLKSPVEIELVGRHPYSGELVKANVMSTVAPPGYFARLSASATNEEREEYRRRRDEWEALCTRWRRLPLIVLAGLR